jgi:hypothetical protein
VELVYDPRKLSGVTTDSPGVAGVLQQVRARSDRGGGGGCRVGS